MKSILVNPATLIDALINTDIKLFMAMSAFGRRPSKRISKKVQILNKRRHRLMNEINKNFHKWLQDKELYPLDIDTRDY